MNNEGVKIVEKRQNEFPYYTSQKRQKQKQKKTQVKFTRTKHKQSGHYQYSGHHQGNQRKIAVWCFSVT